MKHCLAPVLTSVATVTVKLGGLAGFTLFLFWYYKLNLGYQAY